MQQCVRYQSLFAQFPFLFVRNFLPKTENLTIALQHHMRLQMPYLLSQFAHLKSIPFRMHLCIHHKLEEDSNSIFHQSYWMPHEVSPCVDVVNCCSNDLSNLLFFSLLFFLDIFCVCACRVWEKILPFVNTRKKKNWDKCLTRSIFSVSFKDLLNVCIFPIFLFSSAKPILRWSEMTKKKERYMHSMVLFRIYQIGTDVENRQRIDRRMKSKVVSN